MPSFASNSILRMAQFQTPVRFHNHSQRDSSWARVSLSLSWRWIMLHPFLLFDVRLDDFQRSASDSGDEIRMGPQRRKPGTQDGEFLSQQPGRTSLDPPDQPVNTKLRIYLDEKMHMIRHDFELQNLCYQFVADRVYNLLKPSIDTVCKNRSTILRTLYNVIFTGVNHVVI